MAFLDPVTLQAGGVRLEPLGLHHAGPLADAMGDDDPAKEWFARTPSAADVASDIDAKLQAAAAGQWLPFAVLNEGTAVGSTSYLHPQSDIPSVEIGATWLGPAARRTGVNTAAKTLLLTHAFETWGCRRVAFRATWFNRASRAAIERFGATFEGRIRNDRVTREGLVTDSAQYSITDAEWPAVRRHLEYLSLRG